MQLSSRDEFFGNGDRKPIVRYTGPELTQGRCNPVWPDDRLFEHQPHVVTDTFTKTVTRPIRLAGKRTVREAAPLIHGAHSSRCQNCSRRARKHLQHAKPRRSPDNDRLRGCHHQMIERRTPRNRPHRCHETGSELHITGRGCSPQNGLRFRRSGQRRAVGCCVDADEFGLSHVRITVD